MDILFNLNSAVKKQKILYPWKGALKAGTPLAADGAVTNGSTAVGLVAQDYPEYWAKEIYPDGNYYAEVEIITDGYIDINAAEANCGLVYADDLKSALTGIVFCDGALPAPDVLPAIEESDEGKVLTVDDGAVVWADASGGGTPDISASDVGKVLTAEANYETVVIIPEQTVTMSGDIALTGVTLDPTTLALGMTATLSASAGAITHDCVMTVVDNSGSLEYQGDFFGSSIRVYYDDGWKMYANLYGETASIVMTAEVVSGYSASWEVGGAVTLYSTVAEGPIYTLDKTYADIAALHKAGKQIMWYYENSDTNRSSAYLVNTIESPFDNKMHVIFMGYGALGTTEYYEFIADTTADYPVYDAS